MPRCRGGAIARWLGDGWSVEECVARRARREDPPTARQVGSSVRVLALLSLKRKNALLAGAIGKESFHNEGGPSMQRKTGKYEETAIAAEKVAAALAVFSSRSSLSIGASCLRRCFT